MKLKDACRLLLLVISCALLAVGAYELVRAQSVGLSHEGKAMAAMWEATWAILFYSSLKE